MSNSTILGVINSNLFRNPGKVTVLLYALCVEAISVLHMEEKNEDMAKHKGYVNVAQRQRKLTDFGASSVTAN